MWWLSRKLDGKDDELEEELRTHFEIEVERRIGLGESREEAERLARREFGNVPLVKEVTRDMWGFNWLESFVQDSRYALREMRKSPGFAAVVVLTIGLGIGASSTVYSVVNGVLLRPLPYSNPDSIAMLWRVAPLSVAFGADQYPWGPREFTLFQEQSKTVESMGAFKPDTFNLTGIGEPAFLEGSRASAGFFPALGVSPALGRFYTPDEDRPGHERVAVLSDRLWRSHFSADPAILNRSIELDGFSYTVIGVMPPGFAFPHAEEMPAMLEFPREAQLWVPLAAVPGGPGGPSELAVVARLRRGVTLPQVQAELDGFAETLVRLSPPSKPWSRSRAGSLEKQIVGDSKRPLLLLLAAVGLVLLISCSNVAGLVLTRSLSRRREFNLRAALGAGHGRLFRQVLTENLLLAAGGGILGVFLAFSGVAFVKAFGPASLPRLAEVTLDPSVLVFAAAITLVTGILFGFAPATGAARNNLADSLKGGTRILGAGGLAPKLRNALLIGQVALALILAVAAGLIVRTFYGLLNAENGFRTERVLTFELSLPPAQYSDPDQMARLYSNVLDKLQTTPGIESAGFAHAVPLGGAPDATGIRVPERPVVPNEQPYANYMFASPGFFSTVGTPLLAGREFLRTDTLDSLRVTIVNRAMANHLWPGQDPIGKHVGVGLKKYPVRTVVGVAADVKQSSLRETVPPQMYVPYTQNEIKVWPSMRTMQLAVRTAADPNGMISSIRDVIHSVDPALPVAKTAELKELVNESMSQTRFAMLLLGAFGALALLLASVGMYGVISHFVAQRTQEIGIRMALGAARANVFGMVLSQGARLAGAGIALGTIAALAAVRMLSSFLYGVRPADPATFFAVGGLLVLVALLACFLPARRAARVDPVIALRNE